MVSEKRLKRSFTSSMNALKVSLTKSENGGKTQFTVSMIVLKTCAVVRKPASRINSRPLITDLSPKSTLKRPNVRKKLLKLSVELLSRSKA